MPSEVDAPGIGSLFSGELGESPFPLYARLRDIGPVVPQTLPIPGAGRPVWVVTRMAEAVQVLKDPARFTVDLRQFPGGANSVGAGFLSDGSSMLSVDDPDHRRLRALVSKAFTPRYVEGLRPRVQEIAEALIDRVQDQGHLDVVEDYAFPLPINVIAGMLGVPERDWPRIRAWSEGLANRLGRDTDGLGDLMRDFGGYAWQLVQAKRADPADDLISRLIGIEEEGERLTERELISMILLLIFAGHETTSNLIATGTLVLLDHPEQLAALRADLRRVPPAVEELLRFHGPAITAGPRFATEAVELGGRRIEKGDLVLVALFSANHDDRHFTDPEELDVARSLQRHVAFGYGIHTCLGAPLARLEGDVAFTTLLRRLPDLHLAVPRDEVSWQPRLNTWTLPSLPVAF